MRVSENWKDYELLDCSDGERLERWGNVILIRPDPQIIWKSPKKHELWKNAHARYLRSSSGGGKWETYKPIPESWTIKYNDLRFNVKPMGFKHTGVFPEQAANWDLTAGIIKAAKTKPRVLNLFAYTGCATVSALAAGAEVTHVDASKGMVSWAKENAKESGLENARVRYFVDDCIKLVEREIRRGSKYDIIIMDPPSYGRGPGGEVWKLEDEIYSLCVKCSEILSDDALLFMINSYTTGLSPAVMQYILSDILSGKFKGVVSADELGLKVTVSGLTLPCGSTAFWQNQ